VLASPSATLRRAALEHGAEALLHAANTPVPALEAGGAGQHRSPGLVSLIVEDCYTAPSPLAFLRLGALPALRKKTSRRLRRLRRARTARRRRNRTRRSGFTPFWPNRHPTSPLGWGCPFRAKRLAVVLAQTWPAPTWASALPRHRGHVVRRPLRGGGPPRGGSGPITPAVDNEGFVWSSTEDKCVKDGEAVRPRVGRVSEAAAVSPASR
jgi:hypothetical protein